MTGVAEGLVIVDKPAGWTSHDVVARVRRLAGTRKVGHAGTLDPQATGVLVLGLQRATRLLTFLVGARKTYRATVRLGIATVTDDAAGDVVARSAASAVTPEAVRDGVLALTGSLQQVPSAVSAIKVDGRRAYARVRSGENVELAARPVTVYRFDVHALRSGEQEGVAVLDVDIEVECSSGTYIRALARDLGAGLRVGGHLSALRRTRVGPYGVELARTMDQLEAELAVVPLAAAARAALPARELSEAEVGRLAHGQRLEGAGDVDGPVAAFAPDGHLVAVIEEGGPTARALLVLGR